MPLRTGRGAVGVAGIDSDKPGLLLTPEESRLLDALSDQAALAIDRVNLAQTLTAPVWQPKQTACARPC